MFKSPKKDLTQPVTLGDFQEFTKDLDKVIAATVREEIRPTEERLEEKITEFKSDILNKVDAVFHEVKAMREEQTAKVGRDDDQDEEISQLKTRVSVVEQQAGIAPLASS